MNPSLHKSFSDFARGCPSCGKPISTDDDKCPHCGYGFDGRFLGLEAVSLTRSRHFEYKPVEAVASLEKRMEAGSVMQFPVTDARKANQFMSTVRSGDAVIGCKGLRKEGLTRAIVPGEMPGVLAIYSRSESSRVEMASPTLTLGSNTFVKKQGRGSIGLLDDISQRLGCVTTPTLRHGVLPIAHVITRSVNRSTRPERVNFSSGLLEGGCLADSEPRRRPGCVDWANPSTVNQSLALHGEFFCRMKHQGASL